MQYINNKILMADMSLKLVKDLLVGDEIMGEGYSPLKITALRTEYRNTFTILIEGKEPFLLSDNQSLYMVHYRNKKPPQLPEVKNYVSNYVSCQKRPMRILTHGKLNIEQHKFTIRAGKLADCVEITVEGSQKMYLLENLTSYRAL
jgi:hypothetical protein